MSWEMLDLMSVSPATTAWHQCLGIHVGGLVGECGANMFIMFLLINRHVQAKIEQGPKKLHFSTRHPRKSRDTFRQRGDWPQKYVEVRSHVGQYPLIICKEESTQTELPILLCEELRWEMLGFRPV